MYPYMRMDCDAKVRNISYWQSAYYTQKPDHSKSEIVGLKQRQKPICKGVF